MSQVSEKESSVFVRPSKKMPRIALLPVASYQLSQTAMEQEQKESDRASANYMTSGILNTALMESAEKDKSDKAQDKTEIDL